MVSEGRHRGFRPKFRITNAIAAGLTKIERARGFLDAAKLSEDWISEMRQRAFVLEAHHSTHIEGTQLTLEQSTRLLAGKKVRAADPDDARELLNYREAFDFVSSYLESGRPITEGIIRQIHKHLVRGVRGNEAAPGEYRRVQNYVVNSATGKVIYTPPPVRDVKPLMSDLIAWLRAEEETHPVLVAGIAQFQFVHIHPFLDGNGRASRLLSTLILYRTGYDFKKLFTISEYYDRDRQAFYRALQSVREKDLDLTGWIEYFVGGLTAQLLEVQARGKMVIQRDLIAQKHVLSPRQKTALGFALEHGGLTIKDFERLCPRTNRRTLQRELKTMVQKGLLSRTGATNRLFYKIRTAVS